MQRKNLSFILLLTLVVASAFTLAHSINWQVKDDYTITFSGGRVNGAFRGLTANIIFDEAHPEKAKFSMLVDAKTINTGNGVMNKEAKESDALDIDNYSNITFESSAIRKLASGYEVTGDFTMKGMTKSVTIPFTFEKTGEEAVFHGKFALNPKEYHVNKLGAKSHREMPDRIIVDINVPVK